MRPRVQAHGTAGQPVVPLGLYGMIDPAVVVGVAPVEALHAEALRQGTILLGEGVRTLQLRVKGVTTAQRLVILADLVKVSGHLGLAREPACWVVNDDVAAVHGLLGAPAVVKDDAHFPPSHAPTPPTSRPLPVLAHLGQHDGADPDVPFGRSTHTLAQVMACGRASYLGFGPVFGTATKDTGYSPRGVAALSEAVRASPVPVVAIGGITRANLDAVRATGVHAWAVIGAIWRSPDPVATIRAMR